MNTPLKRAALSCALLASTALVSPALAQSTPPKFLETDANGVDLATGKFHFSLPEGSIGSSEGAIALSRIRAGDGLLRDNWTGAVYPIVQNGVTVYVVDLGETSDTFTFDGTSFTPTKANGGKLELLNGSYRYTARDGTVTGYFAGEPGYPLKNAVCGPDCQLPGGIQKPDGTQYSLDWELTKVCTSYDAELNCLNGGTMARLKSVTSSTNYQVSFSYSPDDYYKRTGATLANLATQPATEVKVTYAYPSSGVEEITDTGGRTWRITNSGSAFALRRPGSATDNVTATLGSGGVASAVTNHGVTTNYSHSVSGNSATMTISDPLNRQTVVVSDLAIGRPTSVKDPLNRTTSYDYEPNGRLRRVTRPEGDYVHYRYDARGNVTHTERGAKPNSGAPAITTSAVYPVDCSIPACNQPLSTTDERGNVTEYSYDPTHGGLLTVTQVTAKDLPGTEPDASYTHDLFGRLTSAVQGGQTITFGFDALGRKVTEAGPHGTDAPERQPRAFPVYRAGLDAADLPLLLQGPDVRSEPRPVHADGPDWVRRWYEHIQLCQRGSC